MKCIGCGCKVTLKNTGVLLRPELPVLCFTCKRELLFANIIELK